ncbi:MAG: hypothetical protein ABI824_04425 [Acidobacteriota bacterium]
MKRALLMGTLVMLLTTAGCVRRYGYAANPTYGHGSGSAPGYANSGPVYAAPDPHARGHWEKRHGRYYWVEDRRR